MGFDPVSIGLAAVGTGISAFGKYEEGQSKAANASYQSAVAANNAKIAAADATLDIQAGEVAAVNKGLQTRARVGQQKAAQGAAGIDVNSGSAVDVRAGTEEIGLLDALTVRSDASKRAYAKEVEATSDTAQSQLLTAEASQDETAGDLGSLGTLLSGASTVGKSWASYQQQFKST